MSLAYKLNATKRTEVGSAPSRRLRKEGKVPANVYGLGKDTRHFILESRELSSLLKADAHIIELNVENGEVINTLLKEVQQDYLADITLHVDLQEINMNEKVTANVDLVPVGIPVGISQGGILDQHMHQIEISCLPINMPKSVKVDVSKMELDSIMYIKDIQFPEGVEAAEDAEIVVFQVSETKAQQAESSTEEVAATEPTEENK